MKQKKQVFIAIIILLCIEIDGAKTEGPLKIGNFLLPTSQMPGPLFGFGQNIVDKYDFQIYFNVLQLGGKNANFSTLLPGFLYGIRDDLSLFAGFPSTPSFRQYNNRSKGMNDLFAQLEYAAITTQTTKSSTQLTLVGNMTFPTGSNKKNPPTGFGSPSFFLATTLSHTELYWYIWIQGGAILTTKKHHYKDGNIFYYQSGIEGVITTTKKWLIALIIEFFGQYEQKTKVCKCPDNNSGGHAFFIGPSLWASSEKWIIQIGIAGAPAQNLFGKQPNIQYFFETYINYKFN